MSHLKLQKLAFYCYGAAVGHSVADALGVLHFEPWPHGPVNRAIWRAYKRYGASELPEVDGSAPAFEPALADVLFDTLEVYGRLSAWALRCESHLERPWTEAHEKRSARLDPSILRAHFTAKFASQRVQLPVHLGGSASAALDFIPPARFESLHVMAETLRQLSPR